MLRKQKQDYLIWKIIYSITYVPKLVVSKSKVINEEFSWVATGLKLPCGTASGKCSTSSSALCPIPVQNFNKILKALCNNISSTIQKLRDVKLTLNINFDTRLVWTSFQCSVGTWVTARSCFSIMRRLLVDGRADFSWILLQCLICWSAYNSANFPGDIPASWLTFKYVLGNWKK